MRYQIIFHTRQQSRPLQEIVVLFLQGKAPVLSYRIQRKLRCKRAGCYAFTDNGDIRCIRYLSFSIGYLAFPPVSAANFKSLISCFEKDFSVRRPNNIRCPKCLLQFSCRSPSAVGYNQIDCSSSGFPNFIQRLPLPSAITWNPLSINSFFMEFTLPLIESQGALSDDVYDSPSAIFL